MGLKHKVCINVTDQNGEKKEVLKGGILTIPKRILKFLIGDGAEVLVISSGNTVRTVEIHEIKERDRRCDG